MFSRQRFLATAALLGVVVGGAITGVSSSASAAETVRWLTLDPMPNTNSSLVPAIPGLAAPYAFMYYRDADVLPGRMYFGRAVFRPTPGCTYRGVATGVGAPVLSPSLTSIVVRTGYSDQFQVNWGWLVARGVGGAGQAVVYVVGRCDDGTYEMGNIQWYRWEDGTVGEGPMPPLGPLDPASAQRIWDEGSSSTRLG